MKIEKKIDVNFFNEKSLYLLNIKDLRDIGRNVGVPAPATLKKDALIKYILQIVYGEIEPPLRNSYGRPNVRDVDFNAYIEKIRRKSNVYDDVIGAPFNDISSVFKVASPNESSQTNEIAQRIFVEENGKYYLREYAFVKSESDKEISKEMKDKYDLENFDVVEIITSGKSIKIVSINGKVINDMKKLNEEMFGKKQVFHYSTKEEIKADILNQIKHAQNECAKVVVFSENDYSNSGLDYVKADKNQSSEKAYKEFMALVNLCEKFVYDGENIVVITDESDFIESIIESFDGEVANRIKKHLQSRINEFLALGNALIVFKQDTEAIYQ